MKISIGDIYKDFKESGLFESVAGEGTIVTNIAPVDSSGSGDLVFMDHKKYIEKLIKHPPSAVVTTAELAAALPAGAVNAVLVTKNVSLTHAWLRQKYADRNFRDESEWGKIHPSAVVHPSAKLDPSVHVGPGSVIGKDVVIGKDSVIMPNAVVEYGAKIGEACVIYPGVYIGYECVIGNRVVIKPGSVIGSEGYGFAQDSGRQHHRIPQTGNVVLEDDVLIGANNCIDRANYGETRVGRGTKMDNLCHIAHNVTIGRDCLLTAGFVVAGSTKIGDRMIASGQAGILDHLEIAPDVILVQRAGVTASIKEPGIYAGLPVETLPDYMKSTAIHRKLPEMKKELNELKRKVAELEKK